MTPAAGTKIETAQAAHTVDFPSPTYRQSSASPGRKDGTQGRPTILDDQQFWKIAFDKRDALALLLTLFAKMKQNIGSNILFWCNNLQIGCF